MSGPKRNADSINTIGIVVVGICGAVMVYVSITALQAFYMNDTSELQTMQDYGGQDTTAKSHKAEEMRHILEPEMNTNTITIDRAMDAVVKSASDAKAAGKPASFLVPGACDGLMWTEVPQPGRPVVDPTRVGGCKGGKAPPAPAAPAAGAGSGSAAPAAGSGSGAAPAAGSGAGSAASGSGSAAPAKADKKTAGKNAPTTNDNAANIKLHSTGQGGPGDTHAVGGTSGAPVGSTSGSATIAPGGHAP